MHYRRVLFARTTVLGPRFMGDGAHFKVRAMISGIRPNRGLPQRDPTDSPSNEKSGNKCGNFYAARSRGLDLVKEKTH